MAPAAGRAPAGLELDGGAPRQRAQRGRQAEQEAGHDRDRQREEENVGVDARSCRRGSVSAPSFDTSLTPSTASPSPATPPATPSARLSIRGPHTSRPRVSPSAARTAISWRRPSARTRKRLATLAQPIRKMRPDGAEQDPQRRRDVADHVVAQVAHHRLEAGVGEHRRRRVTGERGREVAKQLIELGLEPSRDRRPGATARCHGCRTRRAEPGRGRPRSGSRARSRGSG